MKDTASDIEEMIRTHFQAEEKQTKSFGGVSQRFFHNPPVDRKTTGLEKRFDRSVQISRGIWKSEDDFSSEPKAEEQKPVIDEMPNIAEEQSEKVITENEVSSEELVVKQPIKMDPKLGTLFDQASVILSEPEVAETEKTDIREQRQKKARPVIHLEPIKINWAQWSPSRGLIDIDAEEKEKAEAERKEQEARAIAAEEAARREAEALRAEKEKIEQEECLAELQKVNQTAYQDVVSAYQKEQEKDSISQQPQEALKLLKDLLKEQKEDELSVEEMDSVEEMSPASEADEPTECEDQQPAETDFPEEKDEERINEEIEADEFISLNAEAAAEPIADLTDEEVIDSDEAVLFDDQADEPEEQEIFFENAKIPTVVEETEEELFSDENTDASEEALFEEEEILSSDLFDEEVIDQEESLFDDEADVEEEQNLIFEEAEQEAVILEEKIEAVEEVFSDENTDASEAALFEEEEILPGDLFDEEVIELDKEVLFDDEANESAEQDIIFEETAVNDEQFFEEEAVDDEKNAEVFVTTEKLTSGQSMQAESGKSKAGKPALAGKPAFFKKSNKTEETVEKQDTIEFKDIPVVETENVVDGVDESVVEIDKDDFGGTGLSFLDADKDFLKAIQLKRETERKETLSDEQFLSISESFFDQKAPEDDREVVLDVLISKADSDEAVIKQAEEMIPDDHPDQAVGVTEVFTDIPVLSSETTEDETKLFFEDQTDEFDSAVEEQPVSEIQPLNDITPSRNSESESTYFDRFSPENSKRIAAMDEFFRLSNSEDEIPSIFDHFPKAGKATGDRENNVVADLVKEVPSKSEQSHKEAPRSFTETATLFTEEKYDEMSRPSAFFFEETIVPEGETLFEESIIDESRSFSDHKGEKAFGAEVFSDTDLFFEEEVLSEDDLFFEEEVLN